MTSTDTAADALRDQLTRRMRAAAEDPFSNAFVRFAVDAGAKGLEPVADAVAALTAQGFEARAERLSHYLEVTDPEENTSAVTALFEQIAGEAEGFAEFQQVMERPAFGIVLTAHPTFALSYTLSKILVELATGLDEAGQPLSQADRDARIEKARGVRHGPPADLSLNVEHRWSVTALNNVWTALESYTRLALQAARARWPESWTELTPRLLTAATWVGFDQDGRTDVTWMVSLDKRLSLKRGALERFSALLTPLQRHDRSEWSRAVAALGGRIQTASAAVVSQASALRACQGEPARLPAFASAMIDSRANALVDKQPIEALLEDALRHAPDEAATETLLVLRAMLRTHGLSLAHVHVRLNAAQLHSAIKADVSLDTSPDDPANRRTYFARINDLIGGVEPQSINFGSLAEEPSSARRLMMTVAQMAKFVDATTRVRFLVAETESGFTLLSALYLARLFGIEDDIEISPLFETEEGLADGERLIEEALRSPHFRAYLEKQGRLAIEFGFSDSGRFIGQMSATFRIERLRLRLAQLLESEGLSHLEVVFFNTHGESIGRGGHPDSLSDRFRYAAPPRSRAEFAERGIRLKEEDSFQGGEGYLPLLTPAAAMATVRAALHASLAADPEAENDPIYQEEDFASEFFASVQQAFTRLAQTTEYPALLGLFGTHLLPKAGSRPTQRQAGDTGAPRPIGSVSELRAIPNNGLLQQLGYLANTIYGVGPAAAKNPQAFARMCAGSPRFRRALRMVSAAVELSDLQATRAYAAVFDPTMWLDRGRADPSCKAAATELSRLACMADASQALAGVERSLLVDRLDQPQILRPELADRSRRRRLQLLHGLRLSVIEAICLLAADLPPLPVTASVRREDLQLRLMRLDVPWALERLNELFPLQEATTYDGADFGEPASYRPDVSHSHAAEHERLLKPLAALFDLAQRISTAVNHEIGACG